MEKPREITIAVWFLWISLAMIIARSYMACLGHDPQSWAKFQETMGTTRAEMVVAIFMTAYIALNAFIIQSVGRGRLWARQLLLFFLLMSFIACLNISDTSISFVGDLGPGTFSPLVLVAKLLEVCAVLILFFNSNAKQYFRGRA